MILKELPTQIRDYSSLKEIEVIKVIIWWAHTYGDKDFVTPEDLRSSYDVIRRSVPNGGFTAFLKSLLERKPPHIIKSRAGYKLEHRVGDELTKRYGRRDATVHIERILADLPSKLANPDERTYLEETLICMRHRAFRAAVVMSWNLAYDHLCYWVLNDSKRLANFNAASLTRHPKMKYSPVIAREDFSEMKESHVIEIASAGDVITKNVARVLVEKLTRRNMAAHPGDVSTIENTAEEVVRDLVENVVLRLQ